MSLKLLLPEHVAEEALTAWPTEPRVYERGETELDRVFTRAHLDDYIDTGCLPATETRALKAPYQCLHEAAYSTFGRTEGQRLRALHDERGFTIRVGNLQRHMPFIARVTSAIQQETGYSNYCHVFLTPPGNQGLLHHWDQQLAVITQMDGVKTWELWRPVVEDPLREYQESFRVWKEEYIPQWEAAGPDMKVDLEPGQSLVLPRGWVHNPYVGDTGRSSLHLTFAIRERSPLWLAEQLVARAMERSEFRRVISPRALLGEGLPGELAATRKALVALLEEADPEALAGEVRQEAVRSLEYTT